MWVEFRGPGVGLGLGWQSLAQARAGGPRSAGT